MGIPAFKDSNWADESGLFSFDNVGTPTNVKVYTRRVGDSLEVRGNFSCGTGNGSAFAINLPSKYVISTSKISTSSGGTIVGMFNPLRPSGTFSFFSGNTASFCIFDGSTTGKIFTSNISASTNTFDKNSYGNWGAVGANCSFHFTIPVVNF